MIFENKKDWIEFWQARLRDIKDSSTRDRVLITISDLIELLSEILEKVKED